MARVLVIDDEKNIRKMVRLTLERAGHTVVTAEDGVEGLEFFGDGTDWDVTLTDERLPAMEGHVFIREARRRAPLARIIMMTSFPTFDLAVEVLEAGATDFLRKPFSTDLLRNTVALALERPQQLVHDGKTMAQSVRPSQSTLRTSASVEYLINDVRFWPEKLTTETPSLPGFVIRRAFRMIKAESTPLQCVVGITPHVREIVRQETGKEFSDESPLWSILCRLALSNALWEGRETLPDVVPIYELTPAQLYAARQMAEMLFLMV